MNSFWDRNNGADLRRSFSINFIRSNKRSCRQKQQVKDTYFRSFIFETYPCTRHHRTKICTVDKVIYAPMDFPGSA